MNIDRVNEVWGVIYTLCLGGVIGFMLGIVYEANNKNKRDDND